jgi:predicted  nucleic acid-binding Zn-ribbon protein
VGPDGDRISAYGPVAPTREQEMETLKQQASSFQSALADIQKRIDELAAQTK